MTLLLPGYAVELTVAASDKLAAKSDGVFSVTALVGFPNRPEVDDVLFNNSGSYTSSAFTDATTVIIQAGEYPVEYATGVSAAVSPMTGTMIAPASLNSTGTLTAALCLNGIVTSSTAAAVTATLDTGTAMETAINMEVDEYFDWYVINTGGSNAFTVTATTDHTLVGSGAVAANSSDLFRTRKTAAGVFVTYRLS